jgi:hypothetical protein
MTRENRKTWIVAVLLGLWLALAGWGGGKKGTEALKHGLGSVGQQVSQAQARLEQEATQYLLAQVR